MAEKIRIYQELAVSIIESMIWVILACGTLIMILKALGWLPRKIKKILEQNKAAEIKELFYELNITPNKYIENMKAHAIIHLTKNSSTKDKEKIKKEIGLLVSDRTFKCEVPWGDESSQSLITNYVDLQGLTFVPEINKSLANYMEVLIRNRLTEKADSIDPLTPDCIIVHENASPFLGYEIASRMKLPLIYVKKENYTNFSDIIFNGHQVSEDRKYFLNGSQKLENGIFIADFLMLGPHIFEARSYVNKFGINFSEVFLLAYKNLDGSKKKLVSQGFHLNYWLSINED